MKQHWQAILPPYFTHTIIRLMIQHIIWHMKLNIQLQKKSLLKQTFLSSEQYVKSCTIKPETSIKYIYLFSFYIDFNNSNNKRLFPSLSHVQAAEQLLLGLYVCALLWDIRDRFILENEMGVIACLCVMRLFSVPSTHGYSFRWEGGKISI